MLVTSAVGSVEINLMMYVSDLSIVKLRTAYLARYKIRVALCKSHILSNVN